MSTPFSENIKQIIKSIPRGKVATYGQIAAFAGSPRAARQVVRILHSCSIKDNLPWHRVINGQGKISLKPGQGYESQKRLLKKEGVKFALDGSVDLNQYQWRPE
jgi:methylated-DNA-protein-cysteine methyltransferase-like protein